MSYNIGLAENGQDSLLISCTDYNKLVMQCPQYMQSSYLRMRRSWYMGGVRCHGTESQIDNLRQQLKNCS